MLNVNNLYVPVYLGELHYTHYWNRVEQLLYYGKEKDAVVCTRNGLARVFRPGYICLHKDGAGQG